MVIPERTRRVHRLVLPFFLLKLAVILFSLGSVFLFIIGVDYIHVLGSMSENKSLKGENFKLRQDVQLIRNKVEAMEATLERVRNYAKKLQILTGQRDGAELPMGPLEENVSRQPASRKDGERRSSLVLPIDPDDSFVLPSSGNALEERIERLHQVSLVTETSLSTLQGFLLTRSAIAAATPSLIPISGWISSGFGYRRDPYNGLFRLHTGIDIAAEPGTPVRAPANGVVVFAGYREGYGKVVVLDHGYGISSLFAHNSKLFVGSGLRIKRAEVISQVGSTGHTTGPHLHYEIRKNGVPVNPAPFFSRSRF
ncbi:MAG: M23 family metallopeptidase [Deltaproteobacteria bacterium]|nr:M23 family metallopeptidase [Deltaproteobacteria bacterium]